MTSVAADDLKLVPRRSREIGSSHRSVFSVDVEEWFQVGAFENSFDRKDWKTLESRVDFQTKTVLDVLQRTNTQATFFCLGWVAKRSPSLIKEITEQGHEVGCHGMDHQRVFHFTHQQFTDDVVSAKKLLEDASGQRVQGYRAPSFSMSQDTWSHYSALIEAGFQYSSSVVPAQTDHYGAVGLPRVPFYPLQDSQFVEVPMTVAEVFGRTIPASGGGYFRLLPRMVSSWLMKKAAHQTNLGTIFYMHPWEVDPDQPYVGHAPLKSRFRHYTGQKQMARKVESLLAERPFVSMMDFLQSEFVVDSKV